jgi:hypothetical protein
MATCKHCGKWSGLFVNEHVDCVQAVVQAVVQGKSLRNVTAVPPSKPLTEGGVFRAAFFALCAFGIGAGIVVES